MTSPLTPADCDLRDFSYMPLDVRRLRDSSAATAENPEEFRAAVLLWCAAWHQLPAGSLPDSDRELANLAGFGRFVGEWLKVREGALRGFTLCSDGRLYHRVVCEKALEAWIERLNHRRRSIIGNAKKKVVQPDTAAVDALIADTLARLADLGATDNPCAATESPQGVLEHSLSAAEGAQGKRSEGILREEANASLSPDGDDEKPKKYPDLFEAAWKAYPHAKGRSSRPKALGAWRRVPALDRLALPSAAARYARDGREPKAECGAPGMHLWLRDERYADWLSAPDPVSERAFPGPEHVRAAILTAWPEADAILKFCGWNAEQSAILVPTAGYTKRLAEEAAPAFAPRSFTLRHERPEA